MTSKEALKSMCNHCEKLSIRDGFIGCPYRCISNDYCEEFETIKKDLEILEILKKHIEINECNYDDKDQNCIDVLIPESNQCFKEIKEWLDR